MFPGDWIDESGILKLYAGNDALLFFNKGAAVFYLDTFGGEARCRNSFDLEEVKKFYKEHFKLSAFQ